MGRLVIRLVTLAAACGLLVATAHSLTQARITENRNAFEAHQLREVIDDPDIAIEKFDDDRFILKDGERTTGFLFGIRTLAGYNGRIDLWLGVDVDGNILGVRVREHEETPGLGDPIELAVSNWILSFNGLALDDGTTWQVRRDGGDFDQFTGATVTPRAVVQAVRAGLEQFDVHRDDWLAGGNDEL